MPARKESVHFFFFFYIVWAWTCLWAVELAGFLFAFCCGHTLRFGAFYKLFLNPFGPLFTVSEREMLLFDLTGTGLLTESRDRAVSVEHKQTVGWNHCVRHLPPLCSHSLMAFFDSLVTNKAKQKRVWSYETSQRLENKTISHFFFLYPHYRNGELDCHCTQQAQLQVQWNYEGNIRMLFNINVLNNIFNILLCFWYL